MMIIQSLLRVCVCIQLQILIAYSNGLCVLYDLFHNEVRTTTQQKEDYHKRYSYDPGEHHVRVCMCVCVQVYKCMLIVCVNCTCVCVRERVKCVCKS